MSAGFRREAVGVESGAERGRWLLAQWDAPGENRQDSPSGFLRECEVASHRIPGLSGPAPGVSEEPSYTHNPGDVHFTSPNGQRQRSSWGKKTIPASRLAVSLMNNQAVAVLPPPTSRPASAPALRFILLTCCRLARGISCYLLTEVRSCPFYLLDAVPSALPGTPVTKT